MNVQAETTAGQELQHELQHLSKSWWWFLLLGILLIVCGIVAIAYPFISSVSIVIVLGAMLLIAGTAMVISSFWTGSWSAFLVQLLIGILYVVVGLLITEAPLESTGAFTLLAAAMFIMAGIFRITAAIAIKFPQWGWTVLNGAVSLILGVMIYKQFPVSALWLIGTLFGVDMILNGWNWIMLSLEVRSIPLAIEGQIADAQASNS